VNCTIEHKVTKTEVVICKKVVVMENDEDRCRLRAVGSNLILCAHVLDRFTGNAVV